MVNQGQKPISIWYRGLPPLYSWLPVDFVPSVPMAIFKLAFGCMQHFSWIAGLRLISPGFWCLQCRHLFPESPVSFLTDDRESHALSLILAKDLKNIRWIVGELIPPRWLPCQACMSITLILMHFSLNNKCKPWQCPPDQRWVVWPQLLSLGYVKLSDFTLFGVFSFVWFSLSCIR